MKRYRIFYKSGNSIDIKSDSLTARWSTQDSHVVELSWGAGTKPVPLVAGLHNIEAIWEL